MSGKWEPLSFIQSDWRFLCVHVVNSKFYFWLCLKPDSKSLYMYASCLTCWLTVFQGNFKFHRFTLADIVLTVSSWFEFLCTLRSVNCLRKSSLEFPRYYATSDNFTRIPVVWCSRSKREDWVLSDKTPLYLERRRNPGNWRMELWLWRRFFQLNGCVRPEYKEPQALRLAWNLRKFLFWRGVIIQEIETKRTLFSSQHGSGILG